MMFALPSALSDISSLGLLWTSLSGVYAVKGLYQAAMGSSTHKDFSGEKGLLRFRKRPISRLFMGLGINSVLYMAVYKSYCFGSSNFLWSQSLVDKVASGVSTDEMSVILGSSMLLAHTGFRLHQSVSINVFSSVATIGLLDWASPYIYSLLAGLTLMSEAPLLDGNGFGWFSMSAFSWRHAVGAALFLLVSYQDKKIQYQLAKFRKNRAGHVVSEDHKMPKGAIFEFISSPQFLTEILIHAAIGVTVGFNHKSWWLCTGYVAISHTVRAMGRHQWYRKKFEAFPKDRKAILPFVL